MVRIKDLTTTTAAEIVDLSEIRFGVDVIGIDATRQLSMFELHTELTEARSLSLSADFTLTGTVTEVVTVRPTVAGLDLTVPQNKSAIILNVGPEMITIVSQPGTTSLDVGEWLHVHWGGATHVVTGPVGGTGVGQTDLTATRNTSTYTINSSTGADVTLVLANAQGPGLMPSTTTMVLSTIQPPTEFTDYFWGFTHSGSTGTTKAYRLDYEMSLTSHGLTTATDKGKPIVIRPTPSQPAAVLDDTSATQFPTGILKLADANRVIFCRPGDIIRVRTTLLQGGNAYSIDTSGRYLYWDLSTSGGIWTPTRPADTAPHIPDLLEVIRVNQFNDSTFEARVRPHSPATLIAGAFQPIGVGSVLADASPDVTGFSLVIVDGSGGQITSLVGGINGQRVTLMANDAITIVNSAAISNQSGGNVALSTGQTASYIRQANNVWRQA